MHVLRAFERSVFLSKSFFLYWRIAQEATDSGTFFNARRGVAHSAVDYPRGGGEGKRSGERHFVTPNGNITRGTFTKIFVSLIKISLK